MSKGPKGPRNPVGWGNDDPRVIKRAGRDARSENNRPPMHGSKAEWTLMSGTGAIINWGLGADLHVNVSGERPDATPEGKRRP
jgi:hypothetical protein